MKIKRLHLRNIASIEKADIDFEKDVVEAGTGLPAPMFLISGDTGAGKSVILDGIAMALYGKTPRIESVAGKKNNEFRDAGGREVNVFDIEQYTRLGITEKDECYSEVVFEGNDGREYRARFELGIHAGRKKDPATGKRILLYNTPVQKLTVGSESFEKSEARKWIEEAVGLSFDQFGRMAMLAQGQFAAFLTGDKREREEILEQLTDTVRFSRYGEAVKSLYDKARTALEKSRSAYEADQAHTLSPQQVKELERQYAELAAAKKENDAKRVDNGQKLVEINKLETATAALAAAYAQKHSLEEYVKGKAYAGAVKLVGDWESTVTERQRLADLRGAEKSLSQAREREQILAGEFRALEADLAFRRQEARRREDAQATLGQWLEDRSDRESLYGRSGELLVRMQGYGSLVAALSGLETAIKAEADKTQGLLADEAAKKKAVTDAAAAVETAQAAIDALVASRDALDPQKTIESLARARDGITALGILENEMSAFASEDKACNGLRREIEGDAKTLLDLDGKLEGEARSYELAKKADLIAQTCYSTMSSSIQLGDLRRRLIENHETVCPLCGQHIEKITDDFKGRLTELDASRREAQALLLKAETAWKKAARERDSFSGALELKKKDLKAREVALAARGKAIGEMARKSGLELGEGLPGMIVEARARLASAEADLKAVQLQAEELQKRINTLLKEKLPLQKSYDAAVKAESEAVRALAANSSMLASLQRSKEEKEASRAALFKELSDAIAGFYPSWADELETAMAALRADAQEFSRKREAYGKEEAALGALNGLLKTVGGLRQDILERYPEWKGDVTPRALATDDIGARWRKILGAAGSLMADVNGYKRIVTDCAVVLGQWYVKTGREDKDLDDIGASLPRVEESRALVRKTGEALKSASDAMALASAQRDAAMRALGAETEESIPEKAFLESQKAALESENDTLVKAMTAVSGELEKNRDNLKLLEQREKEMKAAQASFDRWNLLNGYFGGTKFRTLVQTYILRPLLNNANIYLERITDRYRLTCSEENEQLSILVRDLYNKGQIRSVAVLSGGERFMISLALSLALSSLNRPDMNVNILFIDEGFGTLDAKTLESVMGTLEKLQEIAGESNRRVGIISHREELEGRVPTRISVVKKGEGRSAVVVSRG